ncbi:unnamed protein product, partial [Closterium sp. NIES-53]
HTPRSSKAPAGAMMAVAVRASWRGAAEVPRRLLPSHRHATAAVSAALALLPTAPGRPFFSLSACPTQSTSDICPSAASPSAAASSASPASSARRVPFSPVPRVAAIGGDVDVHGAAFRLREKAMERLLGELRQATDTVRRTAVRRHARCVAQQSGDTHGTSLSSQATRTVRRTHIAARAGEGGRGEGGQLGGGGKMQAGGGGGVRRT